jgi:glucose dehydrogenase
MKRVHILVLILCFVFVARGQQQAGKGSNNWSEFHRTNMARWNPYENVLNVNNAGNLQQKWSYYTGGSGAPPVVANGVVYVGAAE